MNFICEAALMSPILDYGNSKESGILPGESITEVLLNRAKDYERLQVHIEEKDKEIERLNAIRDNIIHITFGSGSHQERIRLIKDALKIS